MIIFRITLLFVMLLLISCSKEKNDVLMPLSIWKIAQATETTGQPYVLIDMTVQIEPDSQIIIHKIPLTMGMVKLFAGCEYEKQNKTRLYYPDMDDESLQTTDSIMNSVLMDGYYNGFTFTEERAVSYFGNTNVEDWHSEDEYQLLKVSFDSINGTTSEAVEFFDNLGYFARYYIEEGALCHPPAYGGFPPTAKFLTDEEVREVLLKQKYTIEQADYFCSVNPEYDK